ncbi:MAG: xanthine dehydrogenase family protein subunit M, partial [Chloroflexi bacterium]|nr:xanthine dehydrogenase family protein subunit M [Chloroflexota bacterium]
IAYNDDDGLTLGALTTLRDLTRDPVIGEHYPALARTAHVMASEQVRSFATLGGNLCNASPSADTAPPLIAMGASVVLVGASGARTLPLEDFFLGPGKSALQLGELLKAITVPPPEGAAIYLKHAPRAYMDIAVVGVAVWLRMETDVCRAARIVLGAVAPTPLRARAAEAELIGHPLTDVRIAQAAKTAAGECSPIDDVRGSAWYRKRMVEVLVRRGVDGLVQYLVQKEA